jgi:hypothetical protein
LRRQKLQKIGFKKLPYGEVGISVVMGFCSAYAAKAVGNSNEQKIDLITNID